MLRVRLKELLKENNTNISDLSEATGINRRPLTQLLNNESKMVKFDTLDRIKNYFHLEQVGELLVDEEVADIYFSPQPLENNIVRILVSVDVQLSREASPIIQPFFIDLAFSEYGKSQYGLVGNIDRSRYIADFDTMIGVFKKIHPIQIENFLLDLGAALLEAPYTTNYRDTIAKGLGLGVFSPQICRRLFDTKSTIHVSIPELNIIGDLNFEQAEETFMENGDSYFDCKISTSPKYDNYFQNFDVNKASISLSIIAPELQ